MQAGLRSGVTPQSPWSASPGGLTATLIPIREDMSEDELLEVLEPELAREIQVTAAGMAPCRPGKSASTVSLSDALCDLLGVAKGGGVSTSAVGCSGWSWGGGQCPRHFRVRCAVKGFIGGLRDLMVRVAAGQGPPPQEAPWVPVTSGAAGVDTSAAGVSQLPLVTPAPAGTGAEKAGGPWRRLFG